MEIFHVSAIYSFIEKMTKNKFIKESSTEGKNEIFVLQLTQESS